MLSNCYLILEPISSSEDFCKMQAVLVHLLWAPSIVSVYGLHLRRSWGLSSVAQITVGVIHSIQLWLPLEWGLTDASFAFAVFSDVKAWDPVTSDTLCSLSLTDLQPQPNFFRGLGVEERQHLAIAVAALLEYTTLLLPNIHGKY